MFAAMCIRDSMLATENTFLTCHQHTDGLHNLLLNYVAYHMCTSDCCILNSERKCKKPCALENCI